MKTTATIQPPRAAGLAMLIMGVFILLVVSPIFFFVASKFQFTIAYAAGLVPVAIGVGATVVGTLSYKRPERFGRIVQAETTSEGAENRLDELERLKRRAMVSPEGYEAKRKDILRDL